MNHTKEARTVFKEDITQDVGGGTPFKKGDSNTRTTGENGEIRLRSDDTMQPRDEEGHFAEKALVGEKRKYEHPEHDYKGSNILKRLHDRLSNEKIYNEAQKDVAGAFEEMDKKVLADFIFDKFVDANSKNPKGNQNDYGEIFDKKSSKYLQLKVNGKIGMWQWNDAQTRIASLAQTASYYATRGKTKTKPSFTNAEAVKGYEFKPKSKITAEKKEIERILGREITNEQLSEVLKSLK